MFLLDTPGVLAPRIASVEMGLKLALCGESEPLGAPSCCLGVGPPGLAGCACFSQPGCGRPFRAVRSEPVKQPVQTSFQLPWASHCSEPTDPHSLQSACLLPAYSRGGAVRSSSASGWARCGAGLQCSRWPPGSRNCAGPPGGGGDPGRLPSLHSQQAPALWVSAGWGQVGCPLSPPGQTSLRKIALTYY